MDKRLLGGLDLTRFLRTYWQKRPLVVRQALPDMEKLAAPQDIFRLAADESVESRLVTGGKRWALEHGPFSRRRIAKLPDRRWTLLVQGLNQHWPAADRLLRRFAFLPYARLDDVMVSYAVAGGGVGPHTDSYDVFLVQGQGRRRWRIGRVPDAEFISGLDLRILRRFEPDAEYVMEPGDLLYLPPGWGHDGVALDECMTYSIGFRAPARQELLYEFLVRTAEQICLPGLYTDPDLARQSGPALLPATMVRRTEALVRKLRFSSADVARFLGAYLSEPKPQVVFSRPLRPLAPGAFARKVTTAGLRLDPRSIMLYRGNQVFINGESLRCRPDQRTPLRKLADLRQLAGMDTAPTCLALFHEWHGNGWLHVGSREDP